MTSPYALGALPETGTQCLRSSTTVQPARDPSSNVSVGKDEDLGRIDLDAQDAALGRQEPAGNAGMDVAMAVLGLRSAHRFGRVRPEAQMHPGTPPEQARGDDPRRADGIVAGIRQTQRLGTDEHLHRGPLTQAVRRDDWSERRVDATCAYMATHLVRLTKHGRHEGARGAGVDLLRRTILFDAPLVQDDQAIGHEHRLFRIMGDHERGSTAALEDMERVVADPLAQPDIKPGERFVEQQDARLGCQGAGERDALLLTA